MPEPRLPPAAGGAPFGRYLDVLRHRVFVGIVGLNVVFVSAGYAVFELLPVFAKNEAGVSEKGIGLILASSPLALWPIAAGVCVAAGAGALALERGIPPELRLTPA